MPVKGLTMLSDQELDLHGVAREQGLQHAESNVLSVCFFVFFCKSLNDEGIFGKFKEMGDHVKTTY